MIKYNIGDILRSDVLGEFVIVLTNDRFMYKTFSKRFNSIKEYALTQVWYKINVV
jgi:hypothetical protein